MRLHLSRISRHATYLLATLPVFVSALSAQINMSRADSGSARKIATAVRLRGNIHLDGKLDEAAWASAPPLTDFLQKDPIEGGEPTDKLDVRFLYDDVALYVATRVVNRNPSRTIQAPVSRRDQVSQAERIWISLDAYQDRRTAYSFGVTASGVRADWYHPSDNETNTDLSFDPVWEAAVDRQPGGWTAEMRIPFSQLRFNAAEVQRWGLNVAYSIPSRNENVFWIPVPRNASGWSSRMGVLEGIEGIRPARRLEVMPYVASSSTVNADRDPGDPFDDGRNLEARVGGDLKVGLGPSLTLAATVNPDFGQVEADPAEVNLSAFETFFSEKRPFFIEGIQLLQGAGSYFYSRRIGARPRGAADGDYVDYPQASTILGAAKLTGRLASGASVGALAAVTAPEDARSFDVTTKRFTKTRVAPLAEYGIGRLQKEYGKYSSTIGLTLTGVQRDVSDGEPLAAILNRSAYSGGVDVEHRFAGNNYAMTGLLGFSHIAGDTLAIARAQRSSARYFQRPDAKAYDYDPSRHSLSGTNGSLGIDKIAGKHWLGGVYANWESPGFEINDAGALGTADDISGAVHVTYRETTPRRYVRRYSLTLSRENGWNYDGDRQFGSVVLNSTTTFSNFWQLQTTNWHDFRSQNSRLTRGGPSMGTEWFNVAIVSLTNSSSASTRWQGRVYYGKDGYGAPVNRISGLLSFRPTPQWQFSIAPNYLRAVNEQQYVMRRDSGAASTYGRRYIFGRIDQSTFFADVRLNYTLKPDLTLELYAQPFAAGGAFERFGELPAARSRKLRQYGTDGSTIQKTDTGYLVTDTKIARGDGSPDAFVIGLRDFSVREMRSNMVLRWEYRPGSTLYLVWQQNRAGESERGDLVGLGDLFGGLSEAGTNFFAIKATFWVPVL
jgi:hypothetical protein